jgi:hypothetical protein
LRRYRRRRSRRRVCRSGAGVSLFLPRHLVWRGVSNRRVGAKLLVESASGPDEHQNSKKTHKQNGKFSLSPFNLSHQCSLQGYL